MDLLEKDIEEIIYNSPWLLDDRFVIPKIKGSNNKFAKQINIGGNRLNRYIDLLFKDTRDNRPVIIELKKNSLKRKDIAQILEYRALFVSMDEEEKLKWQSEFGQNYYCPKLMLIGTEASEEVKLSANLAGIEIRTLGEIKDIEIHFNSVIDINDKLDSWNMFLNTGNRTLEERDEWVEEIYDWIKDIVDEVEEVTTIKKICTTVSKNSWITDCVFPFINLPIYYKEENLCGLYEYYDKHLSFSDEHIYFDFIVQSILYNNFENDDILEKMKNRVNELLISKEYEILHFENGIATIKIKRSVLNDYDKFKNHLIILIKDAIYINEQIVELEE